MALKAIYDTLDEIPEKFRELYSDRNGKFELTGVDGVKTQGDVDRVNTSLTQERTSHKATKEKLAKWKDLNPDDVLPKLDRFDELEASAAGRNDEEKINNLVEARIKSKLAPVERERDTLKTQLTDLQTENGTLKQEKTTRIIHDAVREAATGEKVIDTAIADVLMISERVFEVGEDGKTVIVKEGAHATPGLDAKSWLKDMQKTRPHWWPASSGGGARGANGAVNGGDNPWSAKSWNMTKQTEIFNTQGAQVAENMAKQAGTSLGGPRPAMPKN